MFLMDLKEELGKYDKDLPVMAQGDKYLKNQFGSDRGSYYDMFIGISNEYDKGSTIENVGELKQLIKQAYKQKSMTGYKGGEFTIDDYTTVKIGYYGVGGNPVIQYVEEKEGKLLVCVI